MPWWMPLSATMFDIDGILMLSTAIDVNGRCFEEDDVACRATEGDLD